MALQSIVNINVDFYDKKYILINAKQNDKKSRYLSVTCYNNGELFHMNSGEHSAYIRYKKSDGNGVFSLCNIDRKGKILIELTEQMLSSDGICYADLLIVNKGSADVDVETGEIIEINNAQILSTMTFCINVYETPVENSDIESSYEFDGLNSALEKAEAEYTNVIRLAKSYAVGNADDIRENEDVDNAKYYYEQSLRNANNAKESETNASVSEVKAKESETNAKLSETNSSISETNAKKSETNAANSETNAKLSETNSSISETNAKKSETNAANSETNAKESETNAANSERSAKTSEDNAVISANNAKTSETSAGNYCEVVKSVVDSLNSGFIPIGTISFSELETAEKATGFTYNISDDFVTNDSFAEGAGKPYTAGTNVYCRSDGLWDCLGGSASVAATVDEVKSYLGI